VDVAHRALGRALGRVSELARLAPDKTATAVAHQTMEKFFLPILTDQETDRLDRPGSEYRFSFTACPYALDSDGDAELCHAIMAFEERLVERIGGTLHIERRIAEGAPRCKFRVTNDPASR